MDPAGSGRPRRRRGPDPDPVVPVAPNASRSAAASRSPPMDGGRGRRAHVASAEPASSPLLADFPSDLLRVVFLYLTCPFDRVYFAAVCSAWRSAVRALDALTHPVPLLLLPSRDAPSFFSLHSKTPRRLYLPEEARGARFCGSHDGGWVVAAVDPWHGYEAFNLVSRTTVSLPHRLRIRLVFADETTISEHPMVIRTVTFSGAPTAEDCLAAAHVASASNIAFWRPGSKHWFAFQQNGKVLEDIIYYKSEARQGFHVLTNEEDVMVYTPLTPNGDRDAPLEMFLSTYQIPERVGYRSDHRAVSRYLVDSRGKLLMVLRKLRNSARYQNKFKWKIFEMKLEILPQGGSNASWVELHELRGRALFLGRGCSRAFEVSQFNGLQEGVIYYLDDTSFDMSLLNNGREYSGTDMGEDLYKSNKRPKRTRGTRPFPRKFTSEGSLPIWLFP